jgi:hypothetical protein
MTRPRSAEIPAVSQYARSMTLDVIERLTGGRIGIFDVACPLCGPERQSAMKRNRRVLRVWCLEEGFATFHCARCGESGYVRNGSSPAPDPISLARARTEAAERERGAGADQVRTARWLWSLRRPIAGSTAERYLREARRYSGPLPPTLGFLPARGEYPPAMIGAFGIADEPEPSITRIRDRSVNGVHLTRLRADGTGKADMEPNKVMIGRSIGSPIVLAPANDLLGLCICEGIEDSLSAHEATGLGAWAAGCASRLPALADVIPIWIEAVSLFVDDDLHGRRHAAKLAKLIAGRGIEVRRILPNAWGAAA